MRNRTIRYTTVAAVLMIAAVIGISAFVGESVTFAQVIGPLLNSDTIILDVVVRDEATGPVMHETLTGSRIRRTYSHRPNVVEILDVEEERMLILRTDEQTAQYIELEEVEDDMRFIRRAIMKLADRPRTERLGVHEINGRPAVGFTAGPPKQSVTIWADPETALPIRVELMEGRMPIILKNFQFDVPIDPSLVSMQVPNGYTLLPSVQQLHPDHRQ